MAILIPTVSGGASRWISLAGLNFQPSEFGKIIMVFALARFLSDHSDDISENKKIIFTAILAIIPSILVFLQPDYGTALIYLLVVLPMLYWSGTKVFYLFLYIAPIISVLAAINIYIFYFWMIFVLLVFYLYKFSLKYTIFNFALNIASGLVTQHLWNGFLQEYHRQRILSLVNPLSDPQGTGYQLIQSTIAIGSGGIFGKGWGQGTQTHLRFLPVRDSDFILSVGAEELGFLLVIIVMISFLFLIYHLLDFAQKIFNRFLGLVIVGFTFIIFFHMLINMGMIVGIFPVIGLPLPFISYGGTFLLSCFIMIGISNSVISNDL